MTLRVALRSLATRPVRSAVLASGFGFGIAVMAGLLGIGEVILEQARSPALEGGGDVIVSGATGRVTSARFVLDSVLGAPPLAGRVLAASPSSAARLFVQGEDGFTAAVDARGGIPSLERALGDPETSPIDAWVDTARDRAWSDPDPADVLRAMDRFHPVPDVPAWSDSWAEWLYFNGDTGEAKLYLSFIAGPEAPDGTRTATVRLQLERGGRMVSYSDRAPVAAGDLLARAPDLDVGANSVRLKGLRYRIRLELTRESGEGATRRGRAGSPDLTGEITLDAVPGRSLPPFTVRGAEGWRSGYVVPVLSGALAGELDVEGSTLTLDGGTGYHDHNWGFWDGVSWQWGQVAGGGVSVVYGRIRPPVEAADPERIPGFLTVLGPEGPLGFSTDVRIVETDAPDSEGPDRIAVRARGEALDLALELDVDSVTRTRIGRDGPARDDVRISFLQMRATYRVQGRVGEREIEFTAPGAAETFRGEAAGTPTGPRG